MTVSLLGEHVVPTGIVSIEHIPSRGVDLVTILGRLTPVDPVVVSVFVSIFVFAFIITAVVTIVEKFPTVDNAPAVFVLGDWYCSCW